MSDMVREAGWKDERARTREGCEWRDAPVLIGPRIEWVISPCSLPRFLVAHAKSRSKPNQVR